MEVEDEEEKGGGCGRWWRRSFSLGRRHWCHKPAKRGASHRCSECDTCTVRLRLRRLNWAAMVMIGSETFRRNRRSCGTTSLTWQLVSQSLVTASRFFDHRQNPSSFLPPRSPLSSLTKAMAVASPFQTPSTLLHRVRFFDHTPSPITALAFAPLPLPPSAKGKEKLHAGREELGLLVVARENGEVELWEWYRGEEEKAIGNWVLRKVRQICDCDC